MLPDATRGGQPAYWLLVLPPLLILLLWWPSLQDSFQFDDWNVIVDESRVHSLDAWWQSMPGIRPLLKLSYALNWSLQPKPFGFRLLNVLIHAASSLLALLILNSKGLRLGLPARVAWSAALAATLIFALHPVQSEAVTYISGRSSSLAGFFSLLCLYAWSRGPERRWQVLCAMSLIAAACSKETALILPLVLWLYGSDQPLRLTLRRLAPLAVLTAMLCALAAQSPVYRRLLSFSLDLRDAGDNLLTQGHALLYLAGQLLRIEHGNADPELAVITRLDALSLLIVAAWLSTAITALVNLRRRPQGAFAVLWFLLWLLPTHSLLPRLDVANDRQLYLALLGPAWWLGLRYAALANANTDTGTARWRSMGHASLVALVLVLAAATWQRNRIYTTEITFWTDTAQRNPLNARAANNLGMALALACRDDEAREQFERAQRLAPQDYRARINLRLLQQEQLPGRGGNDCNSHSSDR